VTTEPQGKRGIPMHWRVVAAMLLGVLVGPWLGKSAVGLGTLGAVTIQLIKAVATPLLFLAITRAIVTTHVQARAIGRMAMIALLNVSIAITIGLTLSNTLRPGQHLVATATPSASNYADKKIGRASCRERVS
jgi:DAACS family dicarboxylate/amino acid:cation (Na+ or H+) symporter